MIYLDENANFIFANRSSTIKRTFKRNIMDLYMYQNNLHDRDYVLRIQKLYALFVYVDLSLLRFSRDYVKLRAFSYYLGKIVKLLKQIEHSENCIRVVVTELTELRVIPNLEQLKTDKQAELEKYGLKKLEEVKNVDEYLVKAESCVKYILDKLDEERQ